MKLKIFLFCICGLLLNSYPSFALDYNKIIAKYNGITPQEWGETTTGVQTHLSTTKNVIALTFDACGSPKGSSFDANLLDYLIQHQIKATLFLNSRWIKANPDLFLKLSSYPFLEIENHGTMHKPCSVNGQSAYNIPGTNSIEEVIAEIMDNQNLVEQLTKRKPKFYRSGTNYYDEVAVQIAKDLGVQPLGYSVLGDAGATYSAEQVKNALLTAKPGDIVICHMNHPESGTGEGVIQAIPLLQAKGFTFVTLIDVH
jgi:peptidoglycan/xylan/chitin deacetylase (PgdA/CDA1 family)